MSRAGCQRAWRRGTKRTTESRGGPGRTFRRPHTRHQKRDLSLGDQQADLHCLLEGMKVSYFGQCVRFSLELLLIFLQIISPLAWGVR